jgi:sulfur-oxidizing protein SoxX
VRAQVGTRAIAAAAAVAASWASWPAAAADRPALAAHTVVGDAIPDPLEGRQGDATRGRAIVRDRETGNCLICHRAPEPSERFMGDLGPNLAGVGNRLTTGQIRLRLVDQSRLDPATLMPPYYRVDGLTRVADRYRDKPVLDAQQIEDVVAYLSGLKAE